MNFLVLTLDSLKYFQGSAHTERLGCREFNIISDVIKICRIRDRLYWNESESDIVSRRFHREFNLMFTLSSGKDQRKQEYIPVGCVPPALVAISGSVCLGGCTLPHPENND